MNFKLISEPGHQNQMGMRIHDHPYTFSVCGEGQRVCVPYLPLSEFDKKQGMHNEGMPPIGVAAMTMCMLLPVFSVTSLINQNSLPQYDKFLP